MSENMVERVAKKLWLENIRLWMDVGGQGAAFIDWPQATPGQRQQYLGYARVAIAALREPTKEMVYAGARGSGEDSDGVALGAWEAMIDAALAEEAPKP